MVEGRRDGKEPTRRAEDIGINGARSINTNHSVLAPARQAD